MIGTHFAFPVLLSFQLDNSLCNRAGLLRRDAARDEDTNNKTRTTKTEESKLWLLAKRLLALI
jgi:hypothetical protein